MRADRRREDLGAGRAGEAEELVDLVRADVDEDAAVARRIEEPIRPLLQVQRVRPEADGVQRPRRCVRPRRARTPRTMAVFVRRSENSTRVGLTRVGVRLAAARRAARSSSQPGLSASTRSPARIAISPIVARSAGIAAVTTTSTPSSAASRSGTVRAPSCCDASHGPMRSSVGAIADELGAGLDQARDELDHVQVVGADDGELHVHASPSGAERVQLDARCRAGSSASCRRRTTLSSVA